MINYKELDVKIKNIEGFCLSSPYGDGNSFGQPLGLKSIGFVKIETDLGICGYGETYAAVYAPELIEPVVSFFKDYVIGKLISDDNICKKLTSIPFIGRNGLLQSIISAINIAIWDLRGKVLELPCHKILNSNGYDKVKVYASSGTAIFSPEKINYDVNQILEKGYLSYKMRVGVQEWAIDLKRVESARSALKNNELMIDAIMGTINPPWSEKQATIFAKNLSDFDIKWLEEPVHPENIKGLQELCNEKIVPIAAGEAYNGNTEYDLILEKRAVDILQFDATHSGGINFCFNLAKKSNKLGIKNAVHVWGSAIAISANAHLALSLAEIEYLEMPMVSLEITDHMWIQKPQISKGFWVSNDVPGLGIDISDNLRDKYPLKKGSGYRI